MLRLRSLGAVVLEREDRRPAGAATQRKPLALLALLAAAGGAGLSRDRALAYFWPESSQERAGHSLRQLLHSLRRDLDEDLFLTSADLALNPNVITSDVGEFNQALAGNDPERAVALYGGAFLEGFHAGGSFELEQWIELERDRLAKSFRGALETLAVAAEARGRRLAAVDWWRRAAEADPFNSRVAVRTIEALSAAGDRGGALHVAHAHQTRLRQELDAAPDAEVEAAARRVRQPPADASAESASAVDSERPGSDPALGEARRGSPPLASVAVLPFVNLSGDPDDEYFSDGMTDELRNALCRLPGLRVVARTSAFAFKNQNVDARRIGERLNVATLVEGSVRKAGDRVRITAQLVSASDGYNIWSETYERALADVFSAQEGLARAIAGAISPRLAREAGDPLVAPGTGLLEAYTLYLRGRFRLNKRTVEDMRASLGLFEAALAADPGYALAYAGLAEANTMLGFALYGDTAPHEAMPRAKAAARRALAIDPELAEAHGWLAVVSFLYDWDWAAAEEGFRRALALDVRSPFLHVWYSLFLAAMSRHAESLQAAARARALDPLSIAAVFNMGRCHWFAHRYDEALLHLRAALEMEPGNAQAQELLAWILECAGRVGEARVEVERSLRMLGRTPNMLAAYGRVLALSGSRREALEMVRDLRAEGARRYLSPFFEAQVLHALGDLDAVFHLHERGLAERAGYLVFLGTSPFYDLLRPEPRYAALAERLGLPPPRAPAGA